MQDCLSRSPKSKVQSPKLSLARLWTFDFGLWTFANVPRQDAPFRAVVRADYERAVNVHASPPNSLSHRMPAILRPSISTSLGHFIEILDFGFWILDFSMGGAGVLPCRGFGGVPQPFFFSSSLKGERRLTQAL